MTPDSTPDEPRSPQFGGSACSIFSSGTFIRVREDHKSTRAGKDGLVFEDYGEEVAMTFGYDRYCDRQDVQCVGPEIWNKNELDLETAY